MECNRSNHLRLISLLIILVPAFLVSSCSSNSGARGAAGGADTQRLTVHNARNASEMRLAEFYEVALVPEDMPEYTPAYRGGFGVGPPGTDRVMYQKEVWKHRSDSDKILMTEYFINYSEYGARKAFAKRMPRDAVPQRPDEVMGDDAFREFDSAAQKFRITFIKGRGIFVVSSKDRDELMRAYRKLGEKAARAHITQ